MHVWSEIFFFFNVKLVFSIDLKILWFVFSAVKEAVLSEFLFLLAKSILYFARLILLLRSMAQIEDFTFDQSCCCCCLVPAF